MGPRTLQLAYSVLKPIIFGLNIDPEYTHKKAVELIKRTQDYVPVRYSSLQVNLFAHHFFSPLLLAAGFDKNGLLIDHIRYFGFGCSVVGSVTAQQSRGNDGPRLFRFPKERALLNRLGLNNDGAEVIGERIEGKKEYIVNIAKTNNPDIQGDEAIEDYVTSYHLLKHLGIYTEINISCPNTKDGKTFENPENLCLLLNALLAEGKERPLLLKISPNLEQETLQGIVEVADAKVDGYVATNTKQYQIGGLSGSPLKEWSLKSIRKLRILTTKPIVGVGGIFTGKDAYDALAAGADLLQAYTGFIYRGPLFAMKVAKELDSILRNNGITHISEIRN